MGGEAGVSSEMGTGSRFWFRIRTEAVSASQPLPGSADTAEDPTIQWPENTGLSPAYSGRMLVVDDNITNCKVIQALLNKLGLLVSVVNDGQQAVQAIQQAQPDIRPDLIFMDVNMPVMDGYVATQLIREWEASQQLRATPIIALTANAFEDDRQRCAQAGMNDFLTKPIAVPALKAVLGTWLPKASS
jgi:CheY-like chemotaxis protein